MYSIGKVLSVMPVPKVMDYLNVILAPSFEEIQKLVSLEPVSAPVHTFSTEICTKTDL